jgi:3-oxoacyl-[acyl-carrier protein] reductase
VLDGQVVLVTGAGRNLGRAIALRAAALGASVGVNVRADGAAATAVVDRVTALGRSAVALVGDVSSEDDVARCTAECARALGIVTTVIHCAAHRSSYRIPELTLAEWRRTAAVTVDGAFLLTRATLPGMQELGFGRFVFVGGSAVHTGLPVGHTHVATAKSALTGFVRGLAHEGGRFGVTANVVSPGVIAIDDRVGRPPPTFAGWDPVGSSAIGRMATMDEVAALCLHLCRRDAGAITGQVLNVDGGTFSAG